MDLDYFIKIPDQIIATRKGSPLVIGIGKMETILHLIKWPYYQKQKIYFS